MNRNFYLFGIIIMGLYTLADLFQTIIFFRIGYLLYSVQSFANWFIILASTSLIGSVLILIYFYYYQYWSAFRAGIIANIASLCFYIVFYLAFLSSVMGFQTYYLPVMFFSLGASMLFGLSLAFSKTRKKRWLLTGGIYTLIVVISSIVVMIWSMINPELQTQSNSEKINQWLSLAGTLILVPFIILFYNELKTKTDKVSDKQHNSSVVYILGGIVFMVTLIFGIKITKQTYWILHMTPSTEAMVEKFEARIFVNSERDTIQYLLLRPLNYKPEEKQYPLVVSLPYGKYEGAAMAQLLSNNTNRTKYPAFLLVPYCNPGEGWGGIPNHPTVDTLVFETIMALEKEFAIDKSKIYVTGISRGGYGTWHFISTRPEMFAAAIPVCGGGDPQFAQKIVDLSVWAFHGTKDKNVPVSGSRDMIEAIKTEGGNTRYTEFPDKGHNIWEEVKATPDLLDWLFAQEQDSLK